MSENKTTNTTSPPQRSHKQELTELISDQQFRRLLKNLQPSEVMDYLYRFPQLLRQPDNQQVKSHIQNVGKSMAASFIVGILLNINLKRIYPQIQDRPRPLRWSARFAVMTIPVALVYQFYALQERAKLQQYLGRMHTNLVLLGENGKVEEYLQSSPTK